MLPSRGSFKPFNLCYFHLCHSIYLEDWTNESFLLLLICSWLLLSFWLLLFLFLLFLFLFFLFSNLLLFLLFLFFFLFLQCFKSILFGLFGLFSSSCFGVSNALHFKPIDEWSFLLVLIFSFLLISSRVVVLLLDGLNSNNSMKLHSQMEAHVLGLVLACFNSFFFVIIFLI